MKNAAWPTLGLSASPGVRRPEREVPLLTLTCQQCGKKFKDKP